MSGTGGAPGSAQRAFLGWRTTASAMLPIWVCVPFLSDVLMRGGDGFQDLAFVILALLSYCAAVLVVIPAFTFSLGRWLDGRTARRGTRRAVIVFGIYGLGFGVLLTLLLGPAALTPLGAVVMFLAPTLTAVAGRLLAQLTGRAWFAILWGTFALAVGLALALIVALIISAQS